MFVSSCSLDGEERIRRRNSSRVAGLLGYLSAHLETPSLIIRLLHAKFKIEGQQSQSCLIMQAQQHNVCAFRPAATAFIPPS